jgi:hypothetical protein
MTNTVIRLTKIDMDGQVYYSQFTMNLMRDKVKELEQKLAEAESKLARAVEALFKIDNSNEDMKYFNPDIHIIIHETREALKEAGEE